jgi:hypothetical protein
MIKSLNNYIHSNYITGASLEPGVSYEKTIDYVDDRIFDGDSEPTSVLNFLDGTKLSLNQKNLKTLIAMYGPHPDNLCGKTIVLVQKIVGFSGRDVPGVRIEYVNLDRLAAPAAKPALAASNPKLDIRSGRGAWDKYEDPPAPPADAGDGPGEASDGDSAPF